MGDRNKKRHIRTAIFIIWKPDHVTDHPDFQDIKPLSVPISVPTLVKVDPTVAKKRAFEIEGTDARTDAQSFVIV